MLHHMGAFLEGGSRKELLEESYCCDSCWLYMLWFRFILGLMFFELVSILFAIVLDYGNEYMTKENKN